jgi:mRNA interferase RelE/StbE
MSYEVKITSAAQRQLAALPEDVLRRIDSKILSLADNPRPPGVKKLKAEVGLYRIRVGDYRIVYTIDDSISTVVVVKIGHRSDVYE